MINDIVSLDYVIQFLNDLIKIDKKAVEQLFDTRVNCNRDMVDHPSVQVATYNGPARVGILGLLNGIFGTYDDGPRSGWGPIGMVINKDKTLSKFIRNDPMP